jgi:hypothetical protein
MSATASMTVGTVISYERRSSGHQYHTLLFTLPSLRMTPHIVRQACKHQPRTLV